MIDNAHNQLKKAERAKFKASSSATQKFRSDWAAADSSVQQLRKKYNALVESADFHFTYIQKKIGTMSSQSMKTRLRGKLDEKRSRFVDVAKRSNKAIRALEGVIEKGSDIIKALDVIQALDAVSDDTIALNGLIDEANDLLPALDELVNVGNSILENELSK